jgi:hypothetical protein
MSSPDGGDDFVGVGGPAERFAVLVLFYEVAVDGGLEVDDRMKSAALEATLRQCCEEALDRVESRARGRREVEGETQIAVEPGTHFGLVGGVVVEDDVDGRAGRYLGLDGVAEAAACSCRWRCRRAR